MKKILIVDDEKDIVETLSFMLKAKGFECIYALDGETGLNMAKNESPDLVILDVMMPKINGYKICRLLKFDNKYKNIPIIYGIYEVFTKHICLYNTTSLESNVKRHFLCSNV